MNREPPGPKKRKVWGSSKYSYDQEVSMQPTDNELLDEDFDITQDPKSSVHLTSQEDSI